MVLDKTTEKMVSVLNTVDTGHDDMIHDAQMDYYGVRLATCSSDGSVKVFELRNGTQTLAADLKGHYGPVWQVAWAHPKFGGLLASCSYDRKVVVWQEAGGGEWNKLHEYTGHESSVNAVAWAPHEQGLVLACGSSDGSLSVLYNSAETGGWEARKIAAAHTIGCNAVSWCPQGAERRLVTGGCDNLAKVWREHGDRWVEEAKLELHSDWVRDVAWAPNVGVSRSVIATCSQDRRVVVWTSEDGSTWTAAVLHAFDDVMWSVSWSLTGGVLAVSGGDNKVSLWKESAEGQWTCVSDVNKGQAGSEQRAL